MTRFQFTLSGYIDVAEPMRASEAAGEALSLEADGSTSRGLLDPATALHALLVSALVKGLDGLDLGDHDISWAGGSVTVER